MTATPTQIRALRAVVAEVEAARRNAQPGGKYGSGAGLLVEYSPRRPESTGRKHSGMARTVCPSCSCEVSVRKDGLLIVHGPLRNRCAGSWQAASS